MEEGNISCWMAFAHARGFSNKRKMEFLIEVIHNKKIPLNEALIKIGQGNKLGFVFTDREWNGISEASSEMPNYSFLATELSEKGIELINVMDAKYPPTLKKNLKKSAPILIYARGNLDLLSKDSVAIVGARKCGKAALEFTDNIAKRVVSHDYVVVSGFAKGIDRKALDSALEHKGQSIIVLPQGITTYTSQVYYQAMVKGDIVVVSTYHPKAKWSVGLAMDRNKTIYGLAKVIYAAESNSKGGTWEGVLDGLKKERTIFVRVPSKREKNANLLLIEKGAIPVDMNGNKTTVEEGLKTSFKEAEANSEEKKVKKTKPISEVTIQNRAKELLSQMEGKGLTTKMLALDMDLDDKTKKKLSGLLNRTAGLLKKKKGSSNYYYLNTQTKMF